MKVGAGDNEEIKKLSRDSRKNRHFSFHLLLSSRFVKYIVLKYSSLKMPPNENSSPAFNEDENLTAVLHGVEDLRLENQRVPEINDDREL